MRVADGRNRIRSANDNLRRQGAVGGSGTTGSPYGTLQEAVTQVMTGATTTSADTLTPAAWDIFRASVAWADNVTLPVTSRPAAFVVANPGAIYTRTILIW